MQTKVLLDKLNQMCPNTMLEWMNIKFIDYTGEVLIAEMPVNERVHQPFGLLHGGATAALAETVGSVLSVIQFNDDTRMVGTNLNIYHLKSAKDGVVTARAGFIRKGKSTHVVNIEIFNQENEPISYAILTNKIFNKDKSS